MSDLEGRLDRLEREQSAMQREFAALVRRLDWILKADDMTPLPAAPLFPDDADKAGSELFTRRPLPEASRDALAKVHAALMADEDLPALTGTMADLYPVTNGGT